MASGIIERLPAVGPNIKPVRPLAAPRYSATQGLPGMSWVASQPDSYEQIWRNIGEFRPGSLKGGPTDAQAFMLDPINGNAWSSEKQTATLTTPIRVPDVPGKIFNGTLTLDMIDPLNMPFQVTGEPQGVNLPQAPGAPPASGFNPGAFLESRNIDVMGNLPSRLLDYAANIPNIITGSPPSFAAAKNADGSSVFAFQQDGRYWSFLGTADDAELRKLAGETSGQYTDDAALASRLFDQFKKDQLALTAMSSGNEDLDYTAKRAFQTQLDPATLHTGKYLNGVPINLSAKPQLDAFPIVGIALSRMFNPISAATEAEWGKLTPDQRAAYFSGTSMPLMASQLLGSLPLFSGLGAVTSLAAAGRLGTAGEMAFKTYNYALNATARAMAVGLTGLAANTIREWADPVYAETVGRQVDASRPFSDSQAAGLINLTGYFASGTGGAALLGRTGIRLVKSLPGVRTSIIDTPLFRYAYGGSGGVRTVMRHYGGIEEFALRRAVDRSTLTTMATHVIDQARTMWEQALGAVNRGETASLHNLGMIDDLNATLPEERAALASAHLQSITESIHPTVEALARVMSVAKAPLHFFSSDEARMFRRDSAAASRGLEDDIANRIVNQYGPAFWARQFKGNLTTANATAWIARQAERMNWRVDMPALTRELGGNFDNVIGKGKGKVLPPKATLSRWLEHMRLTYQHEYDIHNGTLAEVNTGSEAGQLTMVRQTHLFRDQAHALIEAFKAGDPGAFDALKAAVDRTEELSAWWARKTAVKENRPGSVNDLSTASIIRDLEERVGNLMVRRSPPAAGSPTAGEPLNAFHSKLEAEGQWTLAFKPEAVPTFAPDVGVVGEQAQSQYSAFTVTRDGEILQSPFLDYPFESAAHIEIGNRGMLMTKVDGLTRGWRTWRITEFQKGSMYRLFAHSGAQSTQIEAFFEQVQRMSQEETWAGVGGHLQVKMGPQAVGGFAGRELDREGERIFGKAFGDQLPARYIRKDKTVDYGKVVVDSFQQARSLNLMAGLTSRLKTLGEGGAASMLLGDYAMPLLRFNLSPVFRLGEREESFQLNLMRMFNMNVDDAALAAYRGAGIGVQHGAASQEIVADPMANMLGTPVQRPGTSAAESLAFHTRGIRVPEEQASLDAALTRIPPVELPPVEQGPIVAPFAAGDTALGTGVRELGTGPLDAAIAEAHPQLEAGAPVPGTAPEPPGALVPRTDGSLVPAQDGSGGMVPPPPRPPGVPPTPEHLDPNQPFTMADVEGTPEAVVESLREAERKSWLHRKWDDLWNPATYKEEQSLKLQIAAHRQEFPRVLKASGNRAYEVMHDLGVRDGEMADFLVADRQVYQRWQDTQPGTPEAEAAWQEFMAYTGSESGAQAASDLYSSPEWDTVSALWRLGAKAAQDEAFQVHYFSRYRSTFERSINHPLLGVYPASWAYKVAKEWIRFLYDNRMFGNGTLRLGMSPAVAIAGFQRAQQRAFAMEGNQGTMDDLLRQGPLGNAMFIANLILPGDWSSIPFPLSQSIRLALRGDVNPLHHFERNTVGLSERGGAGAARDVRLMLNSLGDLWKAFQDAPSGTEQQFNRLVTMVTNGGAGRKPSDWRKITTYGP